MAKAKPTSKADASADPNKLVRQQAGTYRTTDDRFKIREADVGWFLVDPEQTNEFGQELIRGPFATLKAVREALPDARAAKSRHAPQKAPNKAPKNTAKREAEPRAAEPSWIDKLSKSEAAGVRKLIGALAREGIDDAEVLTRRDRDGLLPAVAIRLIERRLAALVDELPEQGRAAAREFVQRVTQILSADGSTRGPLPGWMLIETGPEPDPPNRRIDLRR
ncbi:MAG: hypothetical protein ACR2GO_06550 [Candidatus Limnocylindria bacterium]